MKLKKAPVTLEGRDGAIDIKRNRHGIPEISAQSDADLGYGLGWVHANDRQLHTLMMRILLQGRASELLKTDPELIEIDRFMKTMNFLADREEVVAALEPGALEVLECYADGYNHWLKENKTVWELRLFGYQAEPWTIEDSLLIGKVFGYISHMPVVERTPETVHYHLICKLAIPQSCTPSCLPGKIRAVCHAFDSTCQIKPSIT